ncbi:hypothetical protein [Luteolibacter sp. AS25]|uniref:hypothetical protein n=1 Tax=Luteolibacter sp. AS25 TaxID=3135776 RepID=UPI00398AC44F
MIALALLFGFAILMNGSTFAAIQGRFAQQLELPGSAAIPYIPWIAVVGFIAAVIAISSIKKTWIRWCSFVMAILLANVIIAYPILLLNRGSKVVTTKERISNEDLASFKARFPVLLVSYSSSNEGNVIRVRNDQYSQEMREYLSQLTTNIKPNKAEMATPRKPSD